MLIAHHFGERIMLVSSSQFRIEFTTSKRRRRRRWLCWSESDDNPGTGRMAIRRKFSVATGWVFTLLVLSGFLQVSEECPPVCECKWKSGKESVICANAKTKLVGIPSGLDPGTQVLDLSGNSIKSLPANVFLTQNLLNLQKIFLSECSLKSLDRLAFAKLTNLVELDLSGNRQEFVPSHAFSQIVELRELKMNGNPIARISNDAFLDLGRLVRLEMSGCRLGTIELFAFRGLPALEWLRLDNNLLFTVHATSFFPLRSLHGLEIHGNPWNCSCSLQPFRDWMGKNKVPFGVPPVCSQPQRLSGRLWNELELEDFACLPKFAPGQTATWKILEGENITLSCQWEATPDTKIRWYNGNKIVGGPGSYSAGFHISESFHWDGGASSSEKTLDLYKTALGGRLPRNHTSYERGVGIKSSNLSVIRTTPRDAATYTCRAESRAGTTSANYTLIVVQNKAEHLTGRFLLFGAILAALLTLVVSLLLVCVVFGGNSRRHYQSTRVSTDDKLELNHVGETHLGQNGGGRVSQMRNHNHNHNDSVAVTSNSILSRRKLSSESGPEKVYKPLPTQEPDDSSSDLETERQPEQEPLGAVAISTKAIVSSSSSYGESESFPEMRQQQPQIPLNITNPGESCSGESTQPGASLACNQGPGESSGLFKDNYPDLIDEKMSVGPDFASLPRPNKNQTKHYPQQHPYKYYSHQKNVDQTVRGYFHRRNNSDSQSPLLSRSYGNSTEKMTSSGISILSNSSTESSYMSGYQPATSGQHPYTISQGHHNPFHQTHYRGSFKGANFHPTKPPGSYSVNYPTRHRLSMPTSPVHDHYFGETAAPPGASLRHHGGSHDDSGKALLSRDSAGISYVRTATSGPVGPPGNVSYDYHAAQLAAFLEEYRQLQLELMRMSASLQQGGTETRKSPGETNSNFGKQGFDMGSNGNPSVLFKGQSTSPQQQLKSILKNSGNNNNYVA